MATSVSLSYGFIEQDSRNFVVVNGRPGDRRPDVLIVMDSLLTGTPEKKVVMVNKSREKIESVLRDVGPSFVTYHMELVANKGVVSTARFVSVSEPYKLLDAKSYRKPSMRIARFVLWYESLCLNGRFSMAKAIERSIKISILSKEKDDASLGAGFEPNPRLIRSTGTGAHRLEPGPWGRFWLASKDACDRRVPTDIQLFAKEKEDAEDICAICHAKFREDELIGTLECKDRYHAKCIIKRLMHKRECPTCRATFFLYKF